MYKITFKLKSPVSFIELPTFDGILAWCYMKDKYGIVEQKLTIDNPESFDDMPLCKHPDGYFIASWIQYEKEKSIEFTGSWKKRWDNRHEHLTDFGKKVRKVRSNAGEYKAYDMPIVLQNIKDVWFFFASENIERVRYLVANHLWGIGKKTSQGYGEIDSFEITEIDNNPFLETVLRPIPVNQTDLSNLQNLSVKLMGYRPPYWLPENQTFCLYGA